MTCYAHLPAKPSVFSTYCHHHSYYFEMIFQRVLSVTDRESKQDMYKTITVGCLVGLMVAWLPPAAIQQYVMQFELLAQRWKTSHTGVSDQTFDDNQLKEIARYPE